MLAAGMAACAKSEDAAPAHEAEPVAAAPQAPAVAADKATNKPVVERKLIQNAELHVEVASYQEARRALDRELAHAGGFVADARIEHHDGEVSRAELVLRIPQKQLAAFLADAAGFGKVTHEALHSDDVTDSYVDIQARLNNAKRLETRLLELLANKTDGVKDLLEVERELARVREQIEQFETQLKRFDEQVALSTVKMQLTTKRVYAAAPEPTLGERARETLASSWQALTLFGRGLLLFTVALVPWLVPLVLAGWAVRLLVRRLRRKRLPMPAS